MMEENYNDLIEVTTERKTVFEGRVFKCEVKTVRLSDGTYSKREIVLHHGGACILPVDNELNCYMVRQFRSPFESIMLEVPAGKVEVGEEFIECATRELTEETGYVSDNIIDLGTMVCSPGYDSERIGMFMALDLSFKGNHLDVGEFLNVEKYPLSELVSMVESGEITDAKSQICILKAARRLLK